MEKAVRSITQRGLAALAVGAVLLPALVRAQAMSGTTADRTITLPLKLERTIRFTTEEGTWMNVDVAPDGRTLLFDMVGDIYTLPIDGGKAARVIGGGLSWDIDPRWSPDGKQIVFISDRDGSQNLWIANADGTGLRALTKGENRIYISPEWMPDGRAVIVDREGGGGVGAGGAAGASGLHLFHVGGGSG